MKTYFTVYEIDKESKKRMGCLHNVEQITLDELFNTIPIEPEDNTSPDIRYLALGKILRYHNLRYKIVNFILTPYAPANREESILQIILSVERVW